MAHNPSQNDASERLLPLSEVQAALGGFHRTTIYGWIKKGRFPAPIKIGGSSRWTPDDIEAFKAKRMNERRQWT